MTRNEAAQLVRALGERADAHGIASLAEHQRDVLVPYWALGVIQNGGFKYFYEGAYDLADVGHRFATLGFTAVADACQQVVKGIFGDGPPPGPQERQAILDRVDWSIFRSQKLVVFAVSWEELEDAIARYAVAHPDVALGSRVR